MHARSKCDFLRKSNRLLFQTLLANNKSSEMQTRTSSDSAHPPRKHSRNTFAATQPESVIGPTDVVCGMNTHDVHSIRLVSAHPPIPITKLSESPKPAPLSPDPIRAKSYVFGFKNEIGYIPRPFRSTHRLKISRERSQTEMHGSTTKPPKLSKRRHIAVDLSNCADIGSFDEFMPRDERSSKYS
jgi:hypothetical protein